MEKLKFAGVAKEDRNEFYRLMQMYAKELDEHHDKKTDKEALKNWTDTMIERQFDTTRPRHLKLCYLQSNVIGFFMVIWTKLVMKVSRKSDMDALWNFIYCLNIEDKAMAKKCFCICKVCLEKMV